MRKKLYIIGIVIVVFLIGTIVLGIIALSLNRKEVAPIIPGPTGVLLNIPVPTGTVIEISGVPVKNPYTSPVQLNTQGDSLMVQKQGFDLVYLPQSQEFLISITASPFDQNRLVAEQELLKRLGVTEEQACSLKVTITTPFSINPNEAGQNYTLSFCQ